MRQRIAFINPAGTSRYDAQMEATLAPVAASSTDLSVLHLEGVPEDIAFYLPKHIIELRLFELIPRLEEEGYDAVVVGCCFDPGVRVAREFANIPVVGPLEASIAYATYFGRDFSIVTDSPKTAAWISDLVAVYGSTLCRGVHSIEWAVPDMLSHVAEVAEATAQTVDRVLELDGSEVAIVGCTTVAACIEQETQRTGAYADLPYLNPATLALKMAESLAQLGQQGRYRPSRRGLYARHEDAAEAEAKEVRTRFKLVDIKESPRENAASAAPAATAEAPAIWKGGD
jgi:allantoin racemase